jgi:hypothetical protein
MTAVGAFEVEAEIILEKGASPAVDPKAFQARRILDEIGPTIQLPERR